MGTGGDFRADLTRWALAQDCPSTKAIGSHAVNRVLVALAQYANERGECWPSRSTLTRDLAGMAQRDVQNALHALETAGIVSADQHQKGRVARRTLNHNLTGYPVNQPDGQPDGQVDGQPDGQVDGISRHEEKGSESKGGDLTGMPVNQPDELTPPSRFCSRHPNGTNGSPCGACGDARRAREAWKPPKTPTRPHVHAFDPISGWCTGCETREDAA
ncbi:helix-turn-helix domain-containing protein [Microbacterium sp. NPDC089696]|uniref:helix-turn-helix domain-containing protein n=1 Tax=Microbacterium sp. NPDC089696 TaxID=3364199 RepID=UPI003826B25A